MKFNSGFFVVVVVLIFIAGCSGKAVRTSSQSIQKLPSGSLSDGQIKKSLLKEFNFWKGTPHVMGGSSRLGVDCSGFVNQIFKRVLKINVPRSTKLFMNAGKKIKKSDLRPGDIVNFKPPSYPRHVGIYVGNNKFIHSSTSKGVIMTDLNNSYWKKCYHSSRRLFVR